MGFGPVGSADPPTGSPTHPNAASSLLVPVIVPPLSFNCIGEREGVLEVGIATCRAAFEAVRQKPTGVLDYPFGKLGLTVHHALKGSGSFTDERQRNRLALKRREQGAGYSRDFQHGSIPQFSPLTPRPENDLSTASPLYVVELKLVN